MRTAYIGFNQGQYGDLFISLTACRVLKRCIPDSYLVYAVNKQYSGCIDILKLSKDIDEFVVWDGYDEFPLDSDKEKMNALIESLDTEKVHHFNPMQPHTALDWYNYWHQTEEVCVMHKLPRPTDSEMDFQLPKPDLKQEETITICTGRRVEKSGRMNPKALSVEAVEVVKNFAEKNNLTLIQIGGDDEEKIDGVEKFKGNYSESIIKVLQSRFLVSCDTGMIWAASAFSHPTVGLYDLAYYPLSRSCKNWTPKNINQITLLSAEMRQLDLSVFERRLNLINNQIKKHIVPFSKEKQDLFAIKIVGRNGTFLDVGSGCGSENNNTKCLEKLGWTGFAFDKIPNENWNKNRECPFFNIDVSTEEFSQKLKSLDLEKVDYISLDVDSSSYDAICNIVNSGLKFKCMTFEHTWDLTKPNENHKNNSREFLKKNGYKLLFKDVVVEDYSIEHVYSSFEDWWVDEETFEKYGTTYQNITPSEALLIL